MTHRNTSAGREEVTGGHLKNFYSPTKTLAPPEGVKTPIFGLLVNPSIPLK